MKRTSAFLFALPLTFMVNSVAFIPSGAQDAPAPTMAPNLVAAMTTGMPQGIPSGIIPPVSVHSEASPVHSGASMIRPVQALHQHHASVAALSSVSITKKVQTAAVVKGKNKVSNNNSKSKKNEKTAKPSAKEKKSLTAEELAAKKAKEEEDRATMVIRTAVSSGKKDEKFVALTFDDGPSPEYTQQVLAILKEYGIHATFCLVGRQVKKYPELVQQIVAEGHKIANHTMNHDEGLIRRTDKKIAQEVQAEVSLIQSVVPEAQVEYFRAPGGVWNRHVRKLAASWGMKSLGWSVDSKDWQQPGVDAIIDTVNAELHPGGVILMHDAGGNRSETIAALKKLIPSLKKEGYQFSFPG